MTTASGGLILRAYPLTDATQPDRTCRFQTPNKERNLFKFGCLDIDTPCVFKLSQTDGRTDCKACVRKN